MCVAAAAGALGGLSGISSLLGTVMSFVGTMQSARAQQAQLAAQQQQASYQAKVDRNNAQIELWRADDAKRRGELEAKQQQLKVAQDVGKATASFGAGGVVVGEGTPAGYIDSVASLGAQDVAKIRANTSREVWDYEQRAQNFMAQAGMSDLQAGNSNNGQAPGIPSLGNKASTKGSLLGGSTAVSSKWYSYA